MKKRMLSICLALVMVLGLTPVVIAESGTGWSYSGGTLEIEQDGYNPDDFASFASSVTTVKIDQGVNTIVAYSFKNMKNLTTVTWGAHGNGNSQHIVNIGDGAFEGCTNLTSFVLPGKTSTLETVGENAFSGCSSLTTVDLKKSNNVSFGPGAFDGCSSLTTFNYNGSNGPDVNNLLPAVMGDHRLMLSDMIGVMFHISIPACIEDPSTVSVKFTVGPDDTVNREVTVSATPNIPGSSAREAYFNCEINPLEMGDTITAHIIVGTEEKGTAKSYTALKAIMDYKLAYPSGDIYDLVDALHAYGYFIYQARNDINDGKQHAEISDVIVDGDTSVGLTLSSIDLDEVKSAVAQYAPIRSVPDGVTARCVLNLNLYARTNLVVKVNDVVKSRGDIGPGDLDDFSSNAALFTFDDEVTVRACVLSYVYISLANPNNANKTDKLTAIAALYYYNQAANTYLANNP
jgi:hypothetical protein